MPDRELRRVSRLNASGQRGGHLEISCSRCGTVAFYSFTGPKPSIAAVQNFRAKGWHIQATPGKDLCPTCCSTKTAAVVDLKVVPMTVVSKADPPPEPTREERRIIFSKLEATYIDETRGYDKDWSDNKVASDLGVPRAWVSLVREQNFGPEKPREALEAGLKELLSMATKCSDQLRDLRGLIKFENEFYVEQSKRVADLYSQYDGLKKNFNSLQFSIDEIKKVISN